MGGAQKKRGESEDSNSPRSAVANVLNRLTKPAAGDSSIRYLSNRKRESLRSHSWVPGWRIGGRIRDR